MRKSLLTLAVASALAAPTLAQGQAAAASPHTITGNVGFFSEYIFRGLKQTDGKPALQGGFDYAHSSGLYAGTWASNISWLNDSPAVSGYTSSSLEWDFYGGYKGSVGDFGYDVGLLYYMYPGRYAAALNAGTFAEADTLEGYGALSWKWLSAKFSYSLGSETFGFKDSRGSYYFDFAANFPVTEKLALQAHYGIQEFKGSSNACGAATANDTCGSYKDWKLGVTYALPQSFTLGLFYTDTDMNAVQTVNYTNAAGRFLGKDTFGAFLQKTF